MTEILKQLMDVLRPTPGKLVFFLVFAFIWVAGVTQTYAFIDDVPGLEKPPFYDMLRPFNFWFPWVIFSAPLYLLSSVLCSLRDFCSTLLSMFPGMGAVKFPVIGIIYSYLASSWMNYSWNKWLTTPLSRRLALIIPAAPTFLLTGFPFLLVVTPSNAAFFLSPLPPVYLAFTFYTVSFYGVWRELGSTFKLIRGLRGAREGSC